MDIAPVLSYLLSSGVNPMPHRCRDMRNKAFFVISLAASLCWSGSAVAFRSCAIPDSHAYRASTRYVVGEIAFDEQTGQAHGTETTYNYSNQADVGFSECHVTYELSGSYIPGQEGVFVLDATRTNYSDSCPSRLIESRYPQTQLYALQMEFGHDSRSTVSIAGSGEFLADGNWAVGRVLYKTEEECTII
jgi:hypothetical protein